MTRDSYAKEVMKVVESMHHGDGGITCPRDECDERLNVIIANMRNGTTMICPTHGLIFRE